MTLNTSDMPSHETKTMSLDSDTSALPSTVMADQAASKSAFETVPGFCLPSPALREAVDGMADNAMNGLERITAAMASAPADMQPLLISLRALFRSIGHAADATADDIGADITEIWAVA